MQRDAQHKEEHHDDHNGFEGHRHGRSVHDGCCIDHHEAGEADPRQEEGLVDHGPLPVLAAEHPKHTATLKATCQNCDQVGDDEGGCCRAAGRVVGVEDCEEQHDEHGAHDVDAGCIQDCEDREVIRPAENIAVDLFPTTLVASVQTLQFVLVRGVAREVALQRLHQDDGHDRDQEEAEHEGVHNREPMHLVLEELRVQIARSAVAEGLVRCVPHRGVREVQRGTLVNGPGVRGLHVHLDDLVLIAEEREVPVGEDARQGLAFEMLRHRRHARLHCRLRAVPVAQQMREAADIHAELRMLTDECPDRKIVHVELVPVVVVDHGGYRRGLLGGQHHVAELRGGCFDTEPDVQPRRGEELVTLQGLANAEFPLLHLDVRSLKLAEPQGVVLVRLLRVVVGPYLVRPHDHLLRVFVRVGLLVCVCTPGQRRRGQCRNSYSGSRDRSHRAAPRHHVPSHGHGSRVLLEQLATGINMA
mmetsp:Transcript_13007/g.35434  ORF Transcript_13007/g.35434 Transcript_13007/m.35434 type:complete len:473 (+) Transcript_13007:636-2054(+)